MHTLISVVLNSKSYQLNMLYMDRLYVSWSMYIYIYKLFQKALLKKKTLVTMPLSHVDYNPLPSKQVTVSMVGRWSHVSYFCRWNKMGMSEQRTSEIHCFLTWKTNNQSTISLYFSNVYWTLVWWTILQSEFSQYSQHILLAGQMI